MTSTRLVVFDVDGTLIDSQDIIVAAMSDAFAQVGRPAPSRPEILDIVGLSLREAVSRLMEDADHDEVGDLVARYQQGFVTRRQEGSGEALAPLYDGAIEALDRAWRAEDTLLGVATGKARRGLDHVFRTHRIERYFATAQTADLHPSKPHPSMLRQALRDTGCDAGRAVMIGDTTYDIEMGRAAGFATIGVAWGYHATDRLREAGADRIIEEFAALDDALASLGV